MHVYSHADEILRLNERLRHVEGINASLVMAIDVAFDECKREQLANDRLRFVVVMLGTISLGLALALGWCLL